VLRFLHRRLGNWMLVATALRSRASTVKNVACKGGVSASLAVRVARLAGVAIDDMLGGQFQVPTCPH
jgi:hypothetical protein